ncbi:MAG: hypothetical protein N3G22_00280 [Candidatus Micrarchaeota archaeon]|nr:hypothetical protein [Candidatus Micrarchaeota archaeon]
MFGIMDLPSSVPGIEIRIFLAVAFTAVAAYFDVFKKKWVPNALVYGFAAAALLSNIVFFDWEASLLGFALFAVVFGIAYLLYKAGQLGGADVYALASISALLPVLPKPILVPDAPAAPYPFILSVIAPTGIFFIAHMLLRFVPFVASSIAKGKVHFNSTRLIGPILLTAAFCFFMFNLISLPVSISPVYLWLLSFLFVALLFFSLFREEIKDSMVEFVPASALQEEDVIALERMDHAVVKRLALQPLLSKKSIELLKKAGVKKVPVYTGMPFFLPHLLLGLLVAIAFGDILLYFIKL